MNKNVVLCVTGSIAAYKAADLTSQLTRQGCDVQKARLLLAPAMNGKMWLHPATQQNVATLKSRGAEFIGPEEGLLSCGYEGLGRLWPVEKVAQRALELLG